MVTEFMKRVQVGDENVLRQRLIWLSRIRRWAVVGMMLASLVGRNLFGIHIPIHWLAILAIVTLLYNRYYLRKAMQEKFHPRIAFRQIHFDVIILTLALLITGGFLNPFFTFYFFAVIIAWIVLKPRESVYITVMVTIGFSLQYFAYRINPVDLHLTNEGWLKLGDLPFHVVGAPISFLVTTALTAYFVSVIMGDLRKRGRELTAARLQAELELNKLDNLLRHLEAGMLVVGRNRRMEWVNDRLISWFGEEGRNDNLAVYRIARFAYLFTHHDLHSPRPSSAEYFEMQLPTLSQGVRDFEIVVRPITGADGECLQILEMVLDVTEQKKKNERWAQAQKLAAIGQLAAGMAHEINTPLGTISILAQEVRDMVGQNARNCDCLNRLEIEDYLKTIYEQTHRCKEITQSLLNVSRASLPARDSCRINDLVRRSVELIRPRVPRVQIVEELDANVPTTKTGVGEVERTLFNLLLNAADALESRLDSPCIHIQTGRENGMIFIRVIDNGTGIRNEDMPHIFEPFFTTKTVGKGTGLGLYVSYNAIRDLGGRLEIESECGAGTRATIWLPILGEDNACADEV